MSETVVSENMHNKLMGLTWHSYVPWSRRWTNLICSVHVFEPGVCNIANRSSFVYICAPEDRMCQSLRRIHEIWFCAKIKVMLNKIYELFINSCADKLRRIKFLNYVETKLGYYTYYRTYKSPNQLSIYRRPPSDRFKTDFVVSQFSEFMAVFGFITAILL